MNYKEYYENQAGSGFPVFTGYANQKGHGLGGIFRTIYKFILPLFKTHALPVLKRGGEVLGSEAIKAVSNIANDVITGKNIHQSTKDNVKDAINNLSQKAQSSLQEGGRKRKKNMGKKIKNSFIQPKISKKIRRLKDIFD
jgi:hypothetical protein